jgi:DNA-binding NarL/FixJ family response regulator
MPASKSAIAASRARAERIKQLLAEGLTHRQVTERLGVDMSTVWAAVHHGGGRAKRVGYGR